jgi:tetratricopeptide (TPR) repeat protein
MRHSFSTRLFRGLRTVGAAVAVAALAGTAWSLCIWDTDTIRDELQTKASDFDLVVGQFPHHSKAYYEARVKQAESALAKTPTDIAARNNLAVALFKLGRFQAALEQFEAIEQTEPGRYETRSNLGVLHKKWGKFAAAADYTAKALAIKPSGHLGLGDFYLKMLRWQADRKASPDTVPTTTYLGYAYGESQWKAIGSHKTKEQRVAHIERIKALVRSDRTFPDGLFVLGDLYHAEYDLNLALWAYCRALQLGHSNPTAVQARIQKIFTHWREATRHRGGKVEDPAASVRTIQTQLTKFGTWKNKFEALEAELIAANGLANVDFAKVEAELKRRGIERFRPTPVGITGRSRANNAWGGPSKSKGDARSANSPSDAPKVESDGHDGNDGKTDDTPSEDAQSLRKVTEKLERKSKAKKGK